jgi:hypothetical protein
MTDLDKWETRASRWGFWDMFRNQTMSDGSIITDDLSQKAIAAVGSTLEIPVIDYDGGVTVSNVTQPVTITGSPSTSQMVSVSFTNFYFGFLIHPAQHFNNEISMQREFNTQMKKYVYKLMDDLDIAAAAVLEANKTQVLGDTLGGKYSLTSNVVLCPQASKDDIIGDLNPLSTGNDFFGPIDVVANGSLESHVRNRLLEKGQFNSENKEYQYNDKTWFFSNNLSNSAGHVATGFSVQKGSVGYVQQFAPDCLMGNRTSKHQWDVSTLPLAGLPIGNVFL